MEAPPIAAINGPVAGVEIRNSVESGGAGHAAGAIAMTPVPQHFRDSMWTLCEEYFSVREECLKFPASNALNTMLPLWDTTVENLQQTVKNLDEIRAAAMKTARELQTPINKELLTTLDGQAGVLLQDLKKHLDQTPSVIAAIKKKIADNRAISTKRHL